ncbi:MAG: FMN-binding protein [Candidatus Omnitrophota bacterium]|nr:FMN-binding protein [Candidatus Omnitrophota bacterium]
MKALKIIIFVIIMGTVSSALLVGMNSFTEPMISKNEELKLKSAVLDTLEIPYDKLTALNIFKDKVKVLTADKDKFFISNDGTAAFEFYGPGLWGPISGVASINSDLSTIKTIKILHQEETPGLGSRISEHGFLKQFRGKAFMPRLIFMPEGKASANNEVDAITGATGSSKALERLLNGVLQKNAGLLKEQLNK